ncbi:hypothetical protein MODO_3391 [Myroides odoratimimus]|uniref:HNH endonuclease n=1 Tax=Myroides odoratimimus TaxID=76832 RepID=UPI00072766B2|nr:HNH endonuclease [Myroides odoratimimus]GAQ15691.1 hypothetical protein MODO_3391 [Myroides odoratimimus]STZ49446.1 Uncharacterised protein [Myroides odoratimimus]
MSLVFTQDEMNTITFISNSNLSNGEKWSSTQLLAIKRKIKDYYLRIGTSRCCYCKRNLLAEFNMVIDIEHILPKEAFPQYMFTIENLNVSCKKCNMKIKGSNMDFIVNVNTITANFRLSNQYYFIHPNFDDYFSNMKYYVKIKNDKTFTKYKPITPKGKYSYDYFKLNEFEVNDFNSLQGIKDQFNNMMGNLGAQYDRLVDLLKRV